MAGKDLSVVLFIYICTAIVTVISQNITRLENLQILSRQGTQDQQRRIIDGQRVTSLDQRVTSPDQRGTSLDQRVSSLDQRVSSLDQRITSPDQRFSSLDQRFTSLNPRGNDIQGITSLQQRGTDAQTIGSQQRRGNVVQRVTSPSQRGNSVQRGTSSQRRRNLVQLVTSPQRRGNSLQGGTSPQLRRGDSSRRSLVQLRRSSPQRRPTLNLQNLQRSSGAIPRARNFQESLRNVPRRDPRTGKISRGISPTRVTSGQKLQRTGTNVNPLCAPPRSIRCYSWPRNQDRRGAYMCDGRCQGRSCSIPCECSCVDPRLIERLMAMGRISGPELTPLDPRLRATRRQRLRDRIMALQAERRRRPQVQSGTNSNRGGQTNQLSQRRPNFDLNFGISDDVLATLIAQPVLNEIVGPQGINQIIAGEPPPLLMREDRRQISRSPITNEIPQPDIRAVQTSPPRAEPRVELQTRSMGIPVPLSRLNFAPGTESNPAIGNMRVIMSDIRPFEDPTVGMNIDIPNPTPVDVPANNQVTVRQLPGSSVLFVDLTRSSPSAQMRGLQTVNRTSVGSMSGNNVLMSNANQTLPGSIGNGGNLRTFQDGSVSGMNPLAGRTPTQDQCLAQRTELWCDPKEPWDGTPGLFRWCLLNCRADNCDNQRCACACIDELLFKTKYEQLSLRVP